MAWQDALRFLCKEPTSRGQARWPNADLTSAARLFFFFFLCGGKQMFVYLRWTGREKPVADACPDAKVQDCTDGACSQRESCPPSAIGGPPSWTPSPSFGLTTVRPLFTYSSICWIIYSFHCSFGHITTRLEARERWSVHFRDRWPFTSFIEKIKTNALTLWAFTVCTKDERSFITEYDNYWNHYTNFLVLLEMHFHFRKTSLSSNGFV